eukprot:245060-Chlamydomonas_euryale.AAC.1
MYAAPKEENCELSYLNGRCILHLGTANSFKIYSRTTGVEPDNSVVRGDSGVRAGGGFGVWSVWLVWGWLVWQSRAQSRATSSQ